MRFDGKVTLISGADASIPAGIDLMVGGLGRPV